MVAVVALIHGEPGNYGIGFPDFPGAISGGDTIDEALQRGAETLAVYIAALVEDGHDLPVIRTIEEIKADKTFAEDFSDAVAVTIVEADLPGKSVRLGITMDERLIERIDKRAKALGESRSGFLAAAARLRLAS